MSDLDRLIPHRGRMSLLDEVERFADDGVVCRATVAADSPFLDGGAVAAVVALEYMAQAAAVWSGLTLEREGRAPRGGFLVSVPAMSLRVDALAPGDRLLVHARNLYRGADSAAFACAVERGGATIAEATLTAMATGAAP